MFIKKVLVITAIFSLFLIPISAFAAVGFGMDETANKAGLDMTGPGELPKLIGRIIGTGLSLVGVLFFALMLYGGLTWMLAHGNSEQESKALDTITAAIIGIVIVLASYAITNFVFKSVEPSATTAPETVVVPVVEQDEEKPVLPQEGAPELPPAGEPEIPSEPEAPPVEVTCTKNATQANCEPGCKFQSIVLNSTDNPFCVTNAKWDKCQDSFDVCGNKSYTDSFLDTTGPCKNDSDCNLDCTQKQVNCLNS